MGRRAAQSAGGGRDLVSALALWAWVDLGGLVFVCVHVCSGGLGWTWMGPGVGGGVTGPDPHDKQTSKRVHENRLTSSLPDRGLCGNKLKSDNFVA